MADPVPKKQSQSAQVALYLIIGGVLTMIWSGVWWWAMHNGDVTRQPWMSYVCTGLLLTGLALTVIGVLVGRIGASAKPADTASDKPGAPNPGAGMSALPVPGVGAVPMGAPAGYAAPAVAAPPVTAVR